MNEDHVEIQKALETLTHIENPTSIEWDNFYNSVKNKDYKNLNPIDLLNLNFNLGIYFKLKNSFDKASEYFYCIIKFIKLINPEIKTIIYGNSINEFQVKAFYQLSDIYIKKSNLKKAEDCFDSIIYTQLTEIPNLDNDYIFLFQYRKIDKYLYQDIFEKKISLNSINNFNDPFDSLVFHWLNYNRIRNHKKEHIVPMENSYKKVRIACFSGDKKSVKMNEKYAKNVLMWSHYADSHRGVCICYKIKKDFFEKHSIKENEILKIDSVNYVRNQMLDHKININQSFLKKHIDWKYEHEFRLLYFNPSNKEDFISLDLNNEIEIQQIYFGYKCSDSDKKSIESLFTNKCKSTIVNYREESNIYTLEFKSI